jgi:hypothetical protein
MRVAFVAVQFEVQWKAGYQILLGGQAAKWNGFSN